MNQEMDENSLLDQPSDIDELEKAKAIESIVLGSGKDYANTFDDNDDDGDNNDQEEEEDIEMDETDALMIHTADSSVNVTNSMYDESLKSTDAENGSESCMEAKEMDLDSMDSERTTNIVADESTSVRKVQDEHRPTSVSPSLIPAESQPETEQSPPVTSATITSAPSDEAVQVVSSSTVSVTRAPLSSPQPLQQQQQQHPSNKFYYITLVPKTPPKSSNTAVAAPKPSNVKTTTAAAEAAAVQSVSPESVDHSQKSSPIRILEPTKSTASNCVAPPPPLPLPATQQSSSKSIGHTVNLLNNNRILIKKNSHHHHHRHHNASSKKMPPNDSDDTGTSTSSAASGVTVVVNPIAIQKKEGIVASSSSRFHQIIETKNDTAFCAVTQNVKHDVKEAPKVDSKTECKADTNNGSESKQIKKEQLLNENSMDGGGGDGDDDYDNDYGEEKEEEDKKHHIGIVNDINTSDDVVHIATAAAATTVTDEKNSPDAKKIKREYEQLQKTVNQSKILSEFIIVHNKRNQRPTKSGKSKHWKHNLNKQSGVDAVPTSATVTNNFDGKMDRCSSPSSSSVRSASKESDRSSSVAASCSSSNYGAATTGAVIAAASATAAGKRNTRSQNTDFSAKQKRFLKGIQQITRGTDEETDNQSDDAAEYDDDDDLDYYNTAKKQSNINERRKSTYVKTINSDAKSIWDKYCWRCHLQDTNLYCSCCIRSYHANCLKMKVLTPGEMSKWQCPECVEIKLAEKENKKKKFDVKHFNKLLKYAMNRILQDPNLQQFQFPVNKTQNPGYSDIIVNPINLSKIESNIDNLVYTNSESFLSEIKWILHNCSIYFSDNYKVTRAAKALQKVSKQEVGDIETCAECYLNANTMTDNWFTEVCAKPHLILWAKLKGFPYWPAKAMSINSTLVDVRFFGEHDRANIPSKDCYLYSREDPNPPTNKYKRNTIADCVKEVDIYIENIKEKYGGFNYAELKTPFNPQMAEQHLQEMIPGLKNARGRRRSSTARPDLTLKIVKTADNHLSVVKKESATIKAQDQLPPIKRTVDITGDEAVSRTPTPPSAILARRKTSDTRIKRTKSTNRHSDGPIGLSAGVVAGLGNLSDKLTSKAYQLLRRKSMAVEKLDQKRVNVIQANLDLNSSNESSSTTTPSTPEVSFVQYNAKVSKVLNETEIGGGKKQPNSSTKSTLKKRKPSIEFYAPPEKMAKQDNPNPPQAATAKVVASTQSNDDGTVSTDNKSMPDDGNILRSVGLVRKTNAAAVVPEQKKRTDGHQLASNAENAGGARGRSSKSSVQTNNTTTKATNTCDKTNDEMMNSGDGSARTRTRNRTDLAQRVNSHDDSSLVLVPFLEVKKETEIENTASISGADKNDRTSSASTGLNASISLPSSTENTPAKLGTNASRNVADDNLSIVKTETSSDDESLMIIEDDIESSTSALINASKKQSIAIDELHRGMISVRDVGEMIGKNPMPSARKSFPAGPKCPATGSILKARNLATTAAVATGTAANKLPMNNMVCIPLDRLPQLDVTYNSSQPPPLSIVSSGNNNASLLAQNQTTSTTITSSATATAVSSNALSNGPPPLTITTMPTGIASASSTATATAASSITSTSSSMSTPSTPSALHHNNITHILQNLSNGTISDQMASAVTDMLVVRPNPPQLTARPTAPLRSEGDTVFPSEAGSASKTLINNSHRMSDFFRTVIEDTIGDLAVKHPEARVCMLELELEKERNSHQKEVTDLKTNFERMLTEMKKSTEKDRQRTINEIRKQCELERIRSVDEAKRKQWCANCLKEAQFYCCWNTSYCNHVCQRKHWEQHMNTCAQLESTPANVQNMRKGNVKAQPKGEMRSQSVQQLQPQPQIHPKFIQVSGQKDNQIIGGTRSATRNANNPTSMPAMRNILPKNAVVSINSASAQQRHHFNQNIQTQNVKQPSNQSQCIIVGRTLQNWPAGSSKSTASLLHSNAIFIPSTQPYATIANVTPNSNSSGGGGVSLLNTSQSQKSVSNETIIIP